MWRWFKRSAPQLPEPKFEPPSISSRCLTMQLNLRMFQCGCNVCRWAVKDPARMGELVRRMMSET